MKNKEKQTEEMAKVMHDRSREIAENPCGIALLLEQGKTLPDDYAEALYNASCRILPKDNIVLSKEEYGSKLQDAYDNGLNWGTEWSSKETAAKWHYHITTTLLALWKGNKITTEVYNSWIVFFNNLAKQFGVEIKE